MQKFFKTVAVVTAFSVIEKFLGFLYRVYLSRSIGAEGVGLYQVALSVFALLLTLSCSGTPVTVSRFITKYRAEGKKEKIHKIVSAGIIVSFSVAVLLCALFFALKDNLNFLFSDVRTKRIFIVVLPGLIFTSVYAVLKGVFWGNKSFLPYSVLELLEEVCMIITGVALIIPVTDAYAGAYRAGIAVLVSYVFSFLLSVAYFFFKGGRLVPPKEELKPLLASATPVTAMRTVNSLAVSLVSVILPMRLLAAGYTESQAMTVFGSAVGEAIPLLFIPTTLIGSFTLVLVPEISENFYKKNYAVLKADVERSLKFSTAFATLFVPIFCVCGEEIGVLIFGSALCGEYLSASAFLMIFMNISSISTSILNSVGFENKTMLFFIVSSVFMLVSTWVLPQFIGVYALLVGFTFVYGLTSVLNLLLLEKKCGIKPKYKAHLLKTVLAAIPSVLFGLMVEKMLIKVFGTFLTFLFTSMLCGAFTLALFFGFGVIDIGFIFGRIKKKDGKRRLKKLKPVKTKN